MSNKKNENENYEKYIEYIHSQGVTITDNDVYYLSGKTFTVPTSMGRYHSTTQQDIIPLSIRANYIEDIFNLFLQELITGGQRLIGKSVRKAIVEPEKVLPDTYGKLFREVREYH